MSPDRPTQNPSPLRFTYFLKRTKARPKNKRYIFLGAISWFRSARTARVDSTVFGTVLRLPPIRDAPSSFGENELSVLRLQRYTRDGRRQIAAQAGLRVIRRCIPARELARRKLPPRVGCGRRWSASLRQYRRRDGSNADQDRAIKIPVISTMAPPTMTSNAAHEGRALVATASTSGSVRS